MFENLNEFIDELRSDGFNVGLDHFLTSQALLAKLLAAGWLPDNPRQLANWLGPVLCSTVDEQERFGPLFNRWIERSAAIGATETGDTLPAGASAGGSIRSFISGRRWAVLGAALVLPFLLYGANYIRVAATDIALIDPSGRGWQPLLPPPPPDETALTDVSSLDAVQVKIEPIPGPEPDSARVQRMPRWRRLYYVWFKYVRIFMSAVPILTLAALWLRRKYGPGALEKRSTAVAPHLHQLVVRAASDRLFKDARFRRAAVALRLHREVDLYDLEPTGTASASAGNGGLYCPVYSHRKASPEYLILVDRLGLSDQTASWADEIVHALVRSSIYVNRYYFDRDPRDCRTESPGEPHFSLEDLAGRHPEHRLLIFSDCGGMTDPMSGKAGEWLDVFSRWLTRAVFTPEPAGDWGYLQKGVEDSGFQVFPATREGLLAFAESDLKGRNARAALSDAPMFPDILRDRSEVWLANSPPDRSLTSGLLIELRYYLGEQGFRLLQACAVYPLLQWQLTAYLASELLDGPVADLEETLLAIVRLPWFRHGCMPDWLRIPLISGLPEKTERRVRDAITDLLVSALGTRKGVAILIARAAKTRGGIVKRVIQNLRDLPQRLSRRVPPPESPLHDYAFLRFMSGLKAKNSLEFRLPDALRQLLFLDGDFRRGLAAPALFLIAILPSIAIWRFALKPPPLPEPKQLYVMPNATAFASPASGALGETVSLRVTSSNPAEFSLEQARLISTSSEVDVKSVGSSDSTLEAKISIDNNSPTTAPVVIPLDISRGGLIVGHFNFTFEASSVPGPRPTPEAGKLTITCASVGNGRDASFRVEPNPVDFPKVITLTNTGSVPIIYESMATSAFAVISNRNLCTDRTIPPGGNCTISLVVPSKAELETMKPFLSSSEILSAIKEYPQRAWVICRLESLPNPTPTQNPAPQPSPSLARVPVSDIVVFPTMVPTPTAPPSPSPTVPPVPQPEEKTLFDNWNIEGVPVTETPSGSPQFSIDQPYLITYIATYHWNGGRGAVPRGGLSLQRSDGTVFGPWRVVSSGNPGGQNVDWLCQPNVVIPPGTYAIVDPDPKTWSRNGASKNLGFTRVKGHLVK